MLFSAPTHCWFPVHSGMNRSPYKGLAGPKPQSSSPPPSCSSTDRQAAHSARSARALPCSPQPPQLSVSPLQAVTSWRPSPTILLKISNPSALHKPYLLSPLYFSPWLLSLSKLLHVLLICLVYCLSLPPLPAEYKLPESRGFHLFHSIDKLGTFKKACVGILLFE